MASCTGFKFTTFFTTFDGKFTTFYAKICQETEKKFCRKCAESPVKSRKTENLQYYDKNIIYLPWQDTNR